MKATNRASTRPPPIRMKPSRFRCTPLTTSRLQNGGCLQKASAARRRGLIGRVKFGPDHNDVTGGGRSSHVTPPGGGWPSAVSDQPSAAWPLGGQRYRSVRHAIQGESFELYE